MEINKLKEYIKKYNLTKTEIWKHPSHGFYIITRSGIEKIQAKESIEIEYEIENAGNDWCICKAKCEYNGTKIETFGSAKYGKGGAGNTSSWYLAEIAEKRSMSRIVLKAVGLYSQGVFGQDESESFTKPKE